MGNNERNVAHKQHFGEEKAGFLTTKYNQSVKRKKKTFFTEVEKGRENIIKEIMAKNSPNWAITIYTSKKLNIFQAGHRQ